MKTGPWTLSEDTLAIQQLNLNKTFAQVGKILDRPRNAVISRAHRKGWSYPARKEPGKTVRCYSAAPPRNSPPPSFSQEKIFKPLPALEPEQPPPIGSVLLDTAGLTQCRFIHGDARNRICCGDRTLPGRPWCASHAPIVYGTTTRALREAIAAH